MVNPVFDDEYAFLHNLLFLGKLAYSSLSVFDRVLLGSRDADEDRARFARMKERAGKLPEELCCFFRVYSDARNPLKTIFFENYAQKHFRDTGYGDFRAYFSECVSDSERMRSGLLRFYLPKLRAEGEKWEDIPDGRILDAINASSLPPDIKLSLLGFMYEPESMCKKLVGMLDELSVAVRELERENLAEVAEIKAKLGDPEFYSALCEAAMDYSPEDYGKVYIGVVSLNRYELLLMRNNAGEVIIEMGTRVMDTIRYQRRAEPDIPMLGKLLSEPKRVEALKLLMHRDCYSSELAAATNTTDSTMSYHMFMCHDVGIVRMYNIGRRTYYRLNRDYLAALSVYITGLLRDIDDSGR